MLLCVDVCENYLEKADFYCQDCDSQNTCTILFSLNIVDSDCASQIAKQLISFIENKEQRVIIYVDFINPFPAE